MSETRLPREMDERSARVRPATWQPASLLPEPDKQAGYSYRWIRVSLLGQADPRNVSSKTREGWEPVRIEDQPQFANLVDPNSNFSDNIEIGGLLLCKMPSEFVAQRAAYYGRMNNDQMAAVDNNFMRENDPRMPLFKERKSTTSFGNGR